MGARCFEFRWGVGGGDYGGEDSPEAFLIISSFSASSGLAGSAEAAPFFPFFPFLGMFFAMLAVEREKGGRGGVLKEVLTEGIWVVIKVKIR